MDLNRVCNIEHWEDPAFRACMRAIVPYMVESYPGYPRGMEHRKTWEYAQVVLGLEQLGVLGADAKVLSVGAGHEEPIYYLTNTVRWVFATDLYGESAFSRHEAQAGVLFDPDRFARCPYNRRRLVVQHMDALDLRYEEGTFDAAYSLSSIEHFGGFEGAVASLRELHRVVRRGGAVAVATEMVVNGFARHEEPGLVLFTPDAIAELAASVPGLELVEPLDLEVSERTAAWVIPLDKAIQDAAAGHHTDYPHLVLEHQGRHYTSVALFWRKT